MNNFKNDLDERGSVSFSLTGDKGEIQVKFEWTISMRTPSFICRYGDTTLLTTFSSRETHKNLDFLPLKSTFVENSYSKGKLPNTYDLTETKPTISSILASRFIDHSIRSCFSIYDNREIQIVNTVLSYDQVNDPRLAAVWNSSLIPIFIENISFDKVISAVFVGEVNGKLVYNPSPQDLINSPFEFAMTASSERILVAEISAKEISEQRVSEIIEFAFKKIRIDIDKIKDNFLVDKNVVKKRKFDDFYNCPSLESKINQFFDNFSSSNDNWESKRMSLELFVKNLSQIKDFQSNVNVLKFWNIKLEEFVFDKMKKDRRRIDGRSPDQIREIKILNNYLPDQVHGSSLFSRGNTTVLSSITYGKLSSKRKSNDLLIGKFLEGIFFQYNFHLYSVGSFEEIPSRGKSSRREVGHRDLITRTFKYLVPSANVFPYSTRVVSEVLSSEGSSSQASICASSLALIASGFPLQRLVAGISLGIIGDQIVTDINDIEDRVSLIDLKVAGTSNGICSFQMDVKEDGISSQVFIDCLKKAKDARLIIIKKMEDSLVNFQKKFRDSVL